MPTRRGALLIIVTGMAVLILSLSLAFLTSMRADGTQILALVRDVQARAMLVAAECYIQECARIGWGDHETMGWNDIRNHAVGPIPINADPWAGPATMPNAAVWTPGIWPAPGSVMRAPMRVWQRPPYAIRPGSRNRINVVAAGEAGASGLEDDPLDDHAIRLVNHHGMTGSIRTIPEAWKLGSLDEPDPWPVVDPSSNRLDWERGDPTTRTGTAHLAWFRVYRETAADHDGDGSPYYDVVNCNGGTSPDRNGVPIAQPPNASIFLVTCGDGASLGFRDWSEVVTAGAQATFNFDPEQFTLIRAEESILWFRLEWSPFIGDHSGKGMRQGQAQPSKSHPINPSPGQPYNNMIYQTPSHFGSIRWVQRLDREPPTW